MGTSFIHNDHNTMAIFSFRKRMTAFSRDLPGRKTKSLEANQDGTVRADGVFVSSRTLAQRPLSPPTSLSSVTTSSTAESGAATSPPTSWKSSGTKEHNRGAPLVVSNPDKIGE